MTTPHRPKGACYNPGFTATSRGLTVTGKDVLDEAARIAKLTNRPVYVVVREAMRLGLATLAEAAGGRK